MAHRIDPCLPPGLAADVRGHIEASAPFSTYVSDPQPDGVGKGLVRRRTDAVEQRFAIATLTDDLRARGLVDGAIDDTQLALRMIETYVRFPGTALR